VKRSGDWRSLVSFMFTIAVLGLAPPLAGAAHAQTSKAAAESSNAKEIRAATTLFYEALNTAIQGNFDPLGAIWSHRPDISDFSADGGEEFGWNAVHEHIRNMARLYPSGRIGAQNMRVVADGDADGDLGYSVVTETGQMRSPDGPMVKFSQRATNIFRREQGQWKLIHHHADGSLNDGSQVPR
jgi:ketosteroid isomerase-like protein